jgi:flagellar hook protein FlgE
MSFNTALSGLQAARADLDVTANNIANANTTGFKRSTATFADVFSDTQGTAGASAGNGVALAKITQQFDQGKIEDSNSDLHLAINGDGFFALKDKDEDTTVFTRDGSFLLDQNGFLVNAGGLQVQAFPVVGESEDGETIRFSNGVLEPIQLTNPIGAPKATENVTLKLNYRADQPVKPVSAAIGGVLADPADYDITNAAAFGAIQGPISVEIDAAGNVVSARDGNLVALPGGAILSENVLTVGGVVVRGVANDTTITIDADLPAATADQDLTISPTDQASFDYTTTVNVFDSLGNPHSIALYARRVDDNAYLVDAYIDGSTEPVNASPLLLEFDADGNLGPSANGPNVPRTETLAIDPGIIGQGAGGLNITINFSGSTMLGSAFSISDQSQDGRTTGRLTGLEIDQEGIVRAGYTNGLTTPLGKVALATFGNNQGLRAGGGNTFIPTPDSGEAILGEAGTSTFGLIQAGGLETSNVDISQQLVRLITAQRNFQAASKVISTNDQITQTAINLGR